MTKPSLHDEAIEFARRLTDTVQSIVGPTCAPFAATALGDAVVIRQEPDTGIPLNVGEVPLLTLTAEYRCIWDGAGHFLAVEKSAIKVYPRGPARREPIMRYEYIRNPGGGDTPGAHLQIHGASEALSYVMTRSGSATMRGKRLADRVASGGAFPRMCDLHLPVGGSRFRPCLEDVLDILVRELGVDAADGWREALEAGREDWRRSQTGTVVRDAPDEAIRVLRQMGYVVDWQGTGSEPTGKAQRLREL